uniref:Uncharacterized protein n=1 Tax=Sparus aurata TaxID=8175 RepID=A0A671U7N0_SPAAU
ITRIKIEAVPDLTGRPPSIPLIFRTSVRRRLISCCFSRSSSLSRTNSMVFPLAAKMKLSFFLRLYC